MTGATRIHGMEIDAYQVNGEPLFRQMLRILEEVGKSDQTRAPSGHANGGTAAPAATRAGASRHVHKLPDKPHKLNFNSALQSHWQLHQGWPGSGLY